jgi:polyisoprenoid-binding protein YceI
MKNNLLNLLVVTLLLIPFGNAYGDDWQIDIDHSAAHFSIEHMTIAMVRGHFANLTGTGTFDDKTGELTDLKINIGAASVDTGVVKRDDHLRSKDFFEVTRYPDITFVSKEIQVGENGQGTVVGKLTIRGISKEVTLKLIGPTATMTDPWGNLRKGARLTTTIDRTDYGLIYNTTLANGGLSIGNNVDLETDLEFLILNPKLVK